MAINPGAVCYNDDTIFTPGEVVISTKQYIKVCIKKIEQNQQAINKKIDSASIFLFVY